MIAKLLRVFILDIDDIEVLDSECLINWTPIQKNILIILSPNNVVRGMYTFIKNLK